MKPQRDLVALVLSGCAGLSVVVLTVASVFDAVNGKGLSPEYSTLLVGTLGVLIGALAGYIGGRRGDTGDTGERGPTGRHALPDDPDNDLKLEAPHPMLDPTERDPDE